MEDWYWAARDKEPALNAFIIENGKDEMWRRVRREIDPDERCSWMPVHPGSPEVTLEHILNMMLVVVPTYLVNHNQFMFEAAKIPAFAQYLRDGRHSLSNYVSNSIHGEATMKIPRYSPDTTLKLGGIVSNTLGIDDDWYEA